MWAHYGDSHQGVVLAIDVDIAKFNSVDENFIPYQHGDVIYTSTKPKHRTELISQDELMSIGNNLTFNAESYNLAKKALLYKSLEWAYEEEIRVVKKVKHLKTLYHSSKGRFGCFDIVRLNGRPLFCFDLPKGSIKEVYLGNKTYNNITRTKNIEEQEYSDLMKNWEGKNIKIFHCDCDVDSWNLTARARQS